MLVGIMDELKNLRNLFQLNNLDYYLSLVETGPTNEVRNLPPSEDPITVPQTKLDSLNFLFDSSSGEKKHNNEMKGQKSYSMPDLDAILTNSLRGITCTYRFHSYPRIVSLLYQQLHKRMSALFAGAIFRLDFRPFKFVSFYSFRDSIKVLKDHLCFLTLLHLTLHSINGRYGVHICYDTHPLPNSD